MRYVNLQRRRAEQVRGTWKHTGFWYDIKYNPYLSMAAGLGIGIPIIWISIRWPLEPWGLSLIPSTILIACGIWQLRHRRLPSAKPKYGGEKQLLMAMRHAGGSITPVQAALDSSLTVDEAEEILSRLANRGHLHIESCDGTLFYMLPSSHSSKR